MRPLMHHAAGHHQVGFADEQPDGQVHRQTGEHQQYGGPSARMQDGTHRVGDGKDDAAGGEGIEHCGEYAARPAERRVMVVVLDALLGLLHLPLGSGIVTGDDLLQQTRDAIGRQMVARRTAGGSGLIGGGTDNGWILIVGRPQRRTVFDAKERSEQAQHKDEPIMAFQCDFRLCLQGFSIHASLVSPNCKRTLGASTLIIALSSAYFRCSGRDASRVKLS